MKKPQSTRLGRCIRRARILKGYDQRTLSVLANLCPASISHYESGRRNPSPKALASVAKALRVSTQYLTGRAI